MADLTADVAESHRKAPHQVPGPPPSPRKDLGGAGSGNFGHAGRPGEVGGSGEGGAGVKGGGGGGTGGGTGGVPMRTPTDEDRAWIDKNTSHDIEQIGDKPDGGKFLISSTYGVPEYQQKLKERMTEVLGEGHDAAKVAVTMMQGLPDNVRVGFALGKNDNYPDAEVLDMYTRVRCEGGRCPDSHCAAVHSPSGWDADGASRFVHGAQNATGQGHREDDTGGQHGGVSEARRDGGHDHRQ